MGLKTVYVDLDGLGADWEDYVLEHHFSHLSITELNGLPDRDELLSSMYSVEPHLFNNLPVIDKFADLIHALNELSCDWKILTSAGGVHPFYNMVRDDKLTWLYRNFGIVESKVIVTELSSDKVTYAHEDAILIDDFKRNCIEWEQAGGTSIYVDTKVYDVNDLITKVCGLV